MSEGNNNQAQEEVEQADAAFSGNVHQCINRVQSALAKEGIKKHAAPPGSTIKYTYRGIDAVYASLAPLLSSAGLCILPRVVKRDIVERVSSKGGALFYVTVEVEFDFVSAHDGTTCMVRTIGEAMDSGDKATNKAMSVAYKYACFLAFCIPTEGDNDPDATQHTVLPKGAPAPRQEQPKLSPVYDDLELRKKFIAHEMNIVKDCLTLAALKEVKDNHGEQWIQLKRSPVQEEKDGYQAIIQVVNHRYAELTAPKPETPPAQPQQQSNSELLNDDIPF